MCTGWLILQNDHHLFRTHTLARANYWAELAEILHGTLLGGSTWDSRGVFWISIWGLRNGGTPRGAPGGQKYWKFFSNFLNFFDGNRFLDVKIARKNERKPLILELCACFGFSETSCQSFGSDLAISYVFEHRKNTQNRLSKDWISAMSLALQIALPAKGHLNTQF